MCSTDCSITRAAWNVPYLLCSGCKTQNCAAAVTSVSTKESSKTLSGEPCSLIVWARFGIVPNENQRHRASGLNLLVTAIILWNTVYLQRAVDYLRSQGYEPTPSDLTHLSPLVWEHINLTGDYHWEISPTTGPDQFRPLRTQGYFAAAA